MKHKIVAIISLIAFVAGTSQSVAESSKSHVEIYVTAKDTGQRLSKTNDVELADSAPINEKEQYIFADPSKTFQTVIGIGGALTDASAETFYKLPKDKQRQVLKAYFDPVDGIGYTLGRTHIPSCDFSRESYTYVKDGDVGLSSFHISHD